MIYYLFIFFLRREGQAANESVNWSLLCIPPSSIFAKLNFVFVVTQLLRMSEDISKFWFVHQRQNMNVPFFFFYIFFFLYLLIGSIFFNMSNLKMWTTESWLYVSKHKFRLVQHHQQTFSLLFIVPDKAFLHIPVTNWNLFLFAGEYISVHSSKEPPIIELENTG